MTTNMCTHSSAIAAFLPTSSDTNLGHIKDGHHLVHHGFVEAVAAHLLQHATHSCVRYSLWRDSKIPYLIELLDGLGIEGTKEANETHAIFVVV